MDKHSVYVAVSYVVTLGLLLGYLTWMAWRLRAVKDEVPPAEDRP